MITLTTNSTSGNIARDRLLNVIYTDRTEKLFDSKSLELMKYDIYKAVSKYINIKESSIKLAFNGHSNKGFNDAYINVKIYIDNIADCLRKDKND